MFHRTYISKYVPCRPHDYVHPSPTSQGITQTPKYTYAYIYIYNCVHVTDASSRLVQQQSARLYRVQRIRRCRGDRRLEESVDVAVRRQVGVERQSLAGRRQVGIVACGTAVETGVVAAGAGRRDIRLPGLEVCLTEQQECVLCRTGGASVLRAVDGGAVEG